MRLTERLSGLEVGESKEWPVIAPGILPDLSVQEGTVRAERIAAPAGDTGRRYLVVFERSNWITNGLLVCDESNQLVRLEYGSDMAYWHSNSEETQEIDDDDIIRVSRLS